LLARKYPAACCGVVYLLLAKFSFDLVYIVEADSIVVLALAHHRRRPGYWRARTIPV
jgi:hypothetical protein